MEPLIGPSSALQATGETLLFDEYRGALARAADSADTALQAARAAAGTHRRAEALLDRAHVAIAQGEPRRALHLLEELRRLKAVAPDTRFRAVTLEMLAGCNDANLFPDGRGANGLEPTRLLPGLLERMGRANTAQTELRPKLSDLRLEREAMLAGHLSRRLSLRAAFGSAASMGTDTRHAQAVATAAATEADQLLAWVGSDRSDPRFDALILRLAAEIDLLPPDDGGSTLQRAREASTHLGDEVGLGACAVIEGDRAIGSPGTPVVWNFSIRESVSGGSHLSWTDEEREFDGRTGDPAAARRAYTAAESHFGRAGEAGIRGLAAVAIRRAYLALLDGDVAAAAALVGRARAAYESSGDRQGEMLARVQLALVSIWAGAFPEDLDTAGAVGAWGRSTGSFTYALGLGLFAGRVARYWLMRRGDYVRALAGYRFAQALYDALGAKENVAQSIIDQGTVYGLIGQREEAITRLESAYEVRAGFSHSDDWLVPRQKLLLLDLYNLAVAAKDADGMERAGARIRQLLSIAPPEVDVTEAFVRETVDGALRSSLVQARVLAPAYRAEKARDAGDQVRTGALLDQARREALAAPPGERDFLEAIISAHARDWAGAAAAYRRVRERQGQTSVVDRLAALLGVIGGENAELERRRQRERTVEMAATFFTNVRAYPDALAEWEALEKLAGPAWWMREDRPWVTPGEYGEACEGVGQLQRALAFYDEGIGELERRRGLLTRDELKTSLAGGSAAQRLYFQAARTCARLRAQSLQNGEQSVADSQSARLFDYTERGRARGLLDLVAAGTAKGPAILETPEARRWREVGSQLTVWRMLLARAREQAMPPSAETTARIADLETRIESATSELTRLERRLAEADPGLHATLATPARVLTLEEVSGRLAPGTVLLEYLFVDQDFLGLAITSRGMERVHLVAVDARALATRIRRFHALCTTADDDAEGEAAGLAETFLGPFDDLIAGAERLVLVPYGAAHELPFHALPWREAPLGATRTVSYLPSASLLGYVRPDRPLARRTVVAVGNPAGMRHLHPLTGVADELSPLPGAEVEASYVAFLGDDGSEALLGHEATEEAVRGRLGGFPVLHFATHGIISGDAPLLSAISLANGEELSVYELLSLRLDAELVVLSACETARGEQTGGDEILGLTRGLLAAGARSALVTLWPVDDGSTVLLMARFYERLRVGDPPAQALREAQRYLRELTRAGAEADLERIRKVAAANSVVLRGGGAARQGGEFIAGTGPGLSMPPPDRGFAHPYHWAAFVLVG